MISLKQLWYVYSRFWGASGLIIFTGLDDEMDLRPSSDD